MIARLLRQIIPASMRPIRHLENLVRAETGGRVRQGPFEGMSYINRSVGSAFIPKLLGIYERELNGCIEQACAEKFPLIVDVGAAEGYYAIGLARRNPAARVIAFEMEEHGRAALREMAGLNEVGIEDHSGDPQLGAPSCLRPKVELHGKCEFENLQTTLASADRSLVVCDVEGYEEFLLVPEKIPGLARATLLVEMHDFIRPNVTELIMKRFAVTHCVERIWQEARSRADFPFTSWGTRLFPARYLDWAVSEWRPERMSWLWMKPKSNGAPAGN
jgi:hypothetical protein